MQQKIQQLADKLYQEGVQKGEAKAQEIAKAARERADKQLAGARAEAERILAGARKQAEELRRNMETEIKLSSQQALSVVKQQILDVVSASVVDASVAETFTDPKFIAELVKLTVSRWDAASGETPALEVLLPEGKREQLEAAIRKDAAEVLGKGVEVTFSPKLKSGLQVSRADGGFKVSLTDEDFSEFFKDYLRPRTRAFLFGEQA